MSTLAEHFFDKQILVTGGAGFIGSHLVERFLELGARVCCLDNLSTGSENNLKAVGDHGNFTFIKGDITDFETCKQAVEGCDFVSHQAALGSVPRSLENPLRTNAVNVTGFLNMIEASRLEGVENFVFAASSSTYGDSEELPKREDIIGKPLSPYAVTKYVDELYASVYKTSYGFNSIGLRYFNVFGPRQDPNGAYAAVIPKFAQALVSQNAPRINGDGSFSRDFTYIENVVQANLLAVITADPAALNEVYNIACGERTTLNELVAGLKEELSVFDPSIEKIEPEYGEQRKGDVPHSLASIEKARKLLKYDPRYDFTKGLKQAASWYWEQQKATAL
ncbi:MAG: SDR family oxidoreductase [Leeuwenhoekiella sp.]